MMVAIIGSGNVAFHLEKALSGGTDVVAVSPRTLQGLPPAADIYIIAVSDSAIPEVAVHLSEMLKTNHPGNTGFVVAHTSAATPKDVLKPYFKNFGVFYPLQTFSKQRSLTYRDIPMFVDAEEPAKSILRSLASSFADNVADADSQTLTALHVASAFSCNFINHLWTLSADFLSRYNLDFKTLLPLISETCNKAMTLNPADAQTGPARRGDMNTLQRHQNMLADNPSLLEIYNLLSNSILAMYGHPGLPASNENPQTK